MMWIQTQGKRCFINCNKMIDIYMCDTNGEKYSVSFEDINGVQSSLGLYNSEEYAMNILESIMKSIKGYETVYVMPEMDEEV